MSTITTERESELIERYQAGDTSALTTLSKAHAGLIHVHVEQLARSTPWLRDDLKQEAQLAIAYAAGRFETSRGLRFFTYARWWIRAHLWRYLRRHRSVVPLTETRQNREMRIKVARAHKVLGPAASIDEMAELLGEPREALERVLLHMSVNDAEVPQSAKSPGATPEEAFAKAQEHAELRRLLSHLTGREKYIVECLFFGENETLQTVGDRLGITRERVRQLRNRAIEKLRKAALYQTATAA